MTKTVFHFSAVLIFTVFMSMMVFVIVAAYSRKSGATGHDMGSIQRMRYHAEQEISQK